ncbi:MAG: DUF2203 domain-containing protein [Actinomycetota bacterium]
MSERYTIEEADALLSEVSERIERLATLQRRAASGLAGARRRARRNGHRGGLDAALAREMGTLLTWFEENHLLVKGVSPPLVDFPAHYQGREVLLCWTGGEERIGWYHLPDAGFAGRRPVAELEG